MKVQVNAKLNLTLNLGETANGYHLIDSVAVSVDVYDVVEAYARCDNLVSVKGLPNIPNDRNTAYLAACEFVKTFECAGADIVIDKHIPLGAGLGGSSADAAAVVYCMCKLYRQDVNSAKVRDICAKTGSDVNYMLRGGLARLRGKGDDVEYFKADKSLFFVLTEFDKSVLSKDAYSQFDKLGIRQPYADNCTLINLLKSGKTQGIQKYFNNHLQTAVNALSNYAEEYMLFCGRHNLDYNMTGSGSAYYITFDNRKSAAEAAKLLSQNGFNSILCTSVPNGITEV